MTFSELNLPVYLLTAIQEAGYSEPTAVQAAAIPLILSGLDLIVEAKTGSGKTAAFALPVLKLFADYCQQETTPAIHTLVLAPTRELCLQVTAFFTKYGRHLPRPARVATIIGGTDIEQQIDALRRGTDILVATPGRLLDLLVRKEINLNQLKVLVIDEADKILNLGFAAELANIIKILPDHRQNLLISATFPPKVMNLTREVQKDALHISFQDELPSVENICQRAILVDRDNRGLLLRHLIKSENWQLALVFVASKKAARNLASKLQNNGIKAAEFHADLTQEERITALKKFKTGKITILVATDVAARGLDIHKVSHVLNFDLPRSPEDYIHRIGRTARAGESGVAVSFITSENQDHFALIEKRTGVKIALEQIEGYEPTETAAISLPKTGGVKGKRKSKKDKLREST